MPVPALKIVPDSNVIISGSLWRGPSSRVFDYARAGNVIVCASPLILEECVQVLRDERFAAFLKAHRTSPDELVRAFEKIAAILPDVVLPGVVADDPNDNIILGCAAAHGADYIVSGDHHLQDLREFAGMTIVSPRQFVTLWEKL